MRCVYCELPDIRERTIFETPLVRVFPTNIPIVPGHTLVVPKRCVATWGELSPAEIAALILAVWRVRRALMRRFDAKGFHFVVNEGEVAGQTVPHLHVHAVPRKAGDAGITEFDPRKFLYRPGSREPTEEAELRDVARAIRESL